MSPPAEPGVYHNEIIYRNFLTLSPQFVTIRKNVLALFRYPDLPRLTNLMNEDVFLEPPLNPKENFKGLLMSNIREEVCLGRN